MDCSFFFEIFFAIFVLIEKRLYLLVRMSRILEKGGGYLPDSVKYTNVFNLWRLYSYKQMWNLGGDVKYLRKAYQAGKAILSEDAKRYPHYDLLWLVPWSICLIPSGFPLGWKQSRISRNIIGDWMIS